MAQIEVERLQKTFVVRRRAGRLRRVRSEVRAVDGITFAVEAGESVGYVGPNGAGKSTTIKMLTGILVPSGGRVSVLGLDPSRQRVAVARRIGVMFGQRVQLWWDLPLAESFELLRHIYRVPADRHRANLAAFRELLELDAFLATPVRQLSLGQRMRGELVAAMLHDPEIVLLDEPTIGLDVVARDRVRTFLAEMNRERGVTVLLTTHDLSDIERLCSRLLVIDHGRLVYDGGMDELRRRYGGERTLVVELEEPRAPLQVPRARTVRVDGVRQWLRFHPDEATAAQLVAAVAERAPLVDLVVDEPEIEEIIRRIYDRGRAVRHGATTAPPPASD
jgi:ABC-2 type transport system ATP-binding protein